MIKVALLLSSGAVCSAKHRKNSKPELYNQFLFCNSFLLFVRYLHGGRRTPSELGILSFELCAKAHCELFSFELINQFFCLPVKKRQFKIAGEADNNSKLKIPNS